MAHASSSFRELREAISTVLLILWRLARDRLAGPSDKRFHIGYPVARCGAPSQCPHRLKSRGWSRLIGRHCETVEIGTVRVQVILAAGYRLCILLW